MKKNIIKVKSFQKSLICLIVILLMILSFIVGKTTNANADEINYEYQSDNIGYDSTNNSLNADNVKDAIDELYEKVGKCPSGYECFTGEEVNSSNVSHATIISAYTYNENSCVTGEEETCKKTLCYLSKNKNACSSGTIIDYKVNNTEIVRFHVLHDNGTTMTLQAQKNTVYNVAWYSGGNNHQEGPQTIMTALKTATNGWNNVNDITLADGMIEFNDGTSANNNCKVTSCFTYTSGGSGYPYSKLINNASIGSTVKARMITITETATLGCTEANRSCPIYLYNYLEGAAEYCRVDEKCTNDIYTENGNSYNYGYWTMGASSFITSGAWNVHYYGSVGYPIITDTNFGARAVVVVSK